MFSRFLAAIIVFSCIGSVSAKEPKTHVIRMIDYNYEEYLSMLSGRKAWEIPESELLPDTRVKAEALMIDLAVHHGKCKTGVTFEPYPDYTTHARTLELIRSGQEILHPVGVFDEDPRLKEGLLFTRPFLAIEDNYVGFYTHAGRSEILSITDPEKIKDLRFGVGSTWVIDQNVLKAYRLNGIRADSWNSLLSMLELGRVDVVLQPFNLSNDDFSFVEAKSGERFRPIPGMKTNFPSNRIFTISKIHPDGEEMLRCVNAGLEHLESSGLLKQFLDSSGVTTDRTAGMKILSFQ